MDDETKRRMVIPVQRYLFNPPMKLAVFLGVIPGYAILETVGRKSSRRRRTVVGVHREDDILWVVAEQGRIDQEPHPAAVRGISRSSVAAAAYSRAARMSCRSR